MVGIGDQHTDLCRACRSITQFDPGVGAGGGVDPPRPGAGGAGVAGRHGVEEEMKMLTGQLRREAYGLVADAVAVAGHADGGDLGTCAAGAAPIALHQR